MTVTKAPRRGAPRKVESGLNRVLYVRADEGLLEALDQVARTEQAAHPGRVVSRADVARELLHLALKHKSEMGE